jgi:hypothetical protein
MINNILKTMVCISLVAITSDSIASKADSTRLPGDHFSLEAALGQLKDSETPQDFERRINNSSNGVNNLDLNLDGKVDYMRVSADGKGDERILIITAVISENEQQDVAVVEIQKQGPDNALLQIVGDDALYGQSRIVEPFEETRNSDENDQGDMGPSADLETASDIWINVWYWPCVRHCFGPSFVLYVSPWYWGYYPDWWSPWPPLAWGHFHAVFITHHPHYHPVMVHRTSRLHQSIYAPRRVSSPRVQQNFKEPIRRFRETHPSAPRPNNPSNRLQKPRPEQQNPSQPRPNNSPHKQRRP